MLQNYFVLVHNGKKKKKNEEMEIKNVPRYQ